VSAKRRAAMRYLCWLAALLTLVLGMNHEVGPAPVRETQRNAKVARPAKGQQRVEFLEDRVRAIASQAGKDASASTSSVELRLSRIGRETFLQRAPEASAPIAESDRVEYRRGDVREWYVNGPLGLEQGFTLEAPFKGAGRVALELT